MPHDTPPLVGRAAVLATIARRARAGVGTALVGPRRSGGTRVLAEATTTLRRAGAAPARITAPPTGIEPYRAFLPLLDRSLVPRVEAARGAQRLDLLRAALLGLEVRILVVEDLALLDDPAIDLLADLARAGTAVLGDATGLRPAPRALGVLESLAEQGRVALSTLPALVEEDVAALAAHLLGGPVDTELAQLLTDASAGLPGVLTELVPEALAAGAVAQTDGIWHRTGVLPIPRSIRAGVRRAFTELPPDQRGWVAAVAVAGRIADDVAPRIADEAAQAGAGLAGWTAHDYGTASTRLALPATRGAVTEALGAGARSTVLRRLVGVLRSTARPLADEERVALARWRIELGEAPEPTELTALALLPATTTEDRETLLRAAAAGGGGPAAHAALGEHLRRTRRPGEALALIRAALPGAASPAERVQLVRVEAMTVGVVERRSAEALAALDEYVAEYGPVPDLLAVRAALLLLEGRPAESLAVGEGVLSDPARSSADESLAHMQAAFCLRELGHLPESAAAARRFAAGAAAGRAFPNGAALGEWLPLETDVAVGLELDAAEHALEVLHTAARSEQRAADRAFAAYTAGCIRMLRGDPVAAVRLLREADAGVGAWREGWLPRILAELTVAQTLCGAVDEAAATSERLRGLRCPPVQQGRIGLAAAHLAAARGDRGQAIALARDVAARGEATGLLLDAFDGAFAAMLLGDPDAADRVLRIGAEPAGIGREAQRAAARARRDGDPAALDAAAVGLWELGLRLPAVQVAALAADAGSAEASQRLVAWLTRVPDLRLAGVTSGRAGALTAREREVALLASEGRSDRAVAEELGITIRTAQTHLARAYAKLGVHKRSDLKALVAGA